ncbi:MAG TPA: extracellular solute-binding protein [Pseudolysinimonas sp.]|nr:extracellular solute-binding protein [Pseudolysinimonas sp.]
MRRRAGAHVAVMLTLAAVLITGCGGGQASTGSPDKHGDITIWYSNNEQELEWGKQMVEAWNADHPDEQITAQEIPAGSSSEAVIGASIAAGNAPCLIFNTAPVAVAQFQKQGGLVNLSQSFDDAAAYIEDRSGDLASQYADADGDYFQIPWKSNPVVIFYNKEMFAEAGLDPDKPPLHTYDEFLDSARAIVDSGAAPYAIYPSPTSQFFQIDIDFYPLYAAETGGTPLVEDGKATFADDAGERVAEFWRTVYDEGLAGDEIYQGDAFADGKAAMAIVGPWAVAVYQDLDWGSVPVPTSKGTPADEIWTFSDAKNIGLYTACENQGTAWDVVEFATSPEQDGKLLELTGQMPLRRDLAEVYADYFDENPAYRAFGAQTARVVEVPNSPNAVAMLQKLRDAYTGAVVFGNGSIPDALRQAAAAVDDLAAQP